MYMLVASYSYIGCIVHTLTWDPVCEIYTDHCVMQYMGITHLSDRGSCRWCRSLLSHELSIGNYCKIPSENL